MSQESAHLHALIGSLKSTPIRVWQVAMTSEQVENVQAMPLYKMSQLQVCMPPLRPAWPAAWRKQMPAYS
jgi:hypothetical protein